MNELIGKIQQGGVMVGVKGEISKNTSAVGADPTGLGRWNYIDVVNGPKKVRLISAYQSVKSTFSLGTENIQRRRFSL